MPTLDKLADKFGNVKKHNASEPAPPQSQPTATATTLADPPRGDPAPRGPTTSIHATLPPPAACPACGSAILWLDVYRRGWKCPGPSCSPPPIPAVVLARVILADFSEPAWEQLRVEIRRDQKTGRWRKIITTSPLERVEAGAKDAALADFGGGGGEGGGGEAGGSGGQQTATQHPPISVTIDDTLGSVYWWAEMNGKPGREARPTGRVFWRDTDAWWGTSVGDWEAIEKEIFG